MHFEDRRLVKRLLAGDERAFNRFFDDLYPRVYRFALMRMPDPASTQDVTQAALSKALMNLAGYRGEAALFTWLCAICRNEMIDWRRRNNKHQEHVRLIEDHADVRGAVEALASPEDQGPVAERQRTETRRLIQVALDHLPPRYGDALEWKYIEGHSVRDIARRLDVSTDAAQSLLARAKKAFREVYATLATAPGPQAQKTGP